MKTSVRARFSLNQIETLRNIARTSDISVSSIIDKALRPFLTSQIRFPKLSEQGTIHTSFTLDEEKVKELKKLIIANNISWDEAIRLAVEAYISGENSVK